MRNSETHNLPDVLIACITQHARIRLNTLLKSCDEEGQPTRDFYRFYAPDPNHKLRGFMVSFQKKGNEWVYVGWEDFII